MQILKDSEKNQDGKKASKNQSDKSKDKVMAVKKDSQRPNDGEKGNHKKSIVHLFTKDSINRDIEKYRKRGGLCGC